MERDVDEEAARLLDRVAGEVPVPPAPLAQLVGTAMRVRRRRQLVLVLAVVLLLVLALVAL
jgi:hypothetical protein